MQASSPPAQLPPPAARTARAEGHSTRDSSFNPHARLDAAVDGFTREHLPIDTGAVPRVAELLVRPAVFEAAAADGVEEAGGSPDEGAGFRDLGGELLGGGGAAGAGAGGAAL